METVKALDSVGLLNTQAQDIFNPTMGPDLTWVCFDNEALKGDSWKDNKMSLSPETADGFTSQPEIGHFPRFSA